MFILKRNDTAAAIQYALIPTTVNLTGASVYFNMRDQSSKEIKVNRAEAVVAIATGTPTVRYDWDVLDTDESGTFEGEFEVVYADGTVQTFPNNSYIEILINEDIA